MYLSDGSPPVLNIAEVVVEEVQTERLVSYKNIQESKNPQPPSHGELLHHVSCR